MKIKRIEIPTKYFKNISNQHKTERLNMKINKKIFPAFFEEILNGTKTYEFRLNDFKCELGDVLCLREFDGKKYTGREKLMEVVSVLKQEDISFYTTLDLADYGFQIIGLKPGESQIRINGLNHDLKNGIQGILHPEFLQGQPMSETCFHDLRQTCKDLAQIIKDNNIK